MMLVLQERTMIQADAVLQTWIPDPSGTVIFQTQLRLFR